MIQSGLCLIATTLASWGLSLVVLLSVRNFPRFWFIAIHYIVITVIFGVSFYIYRRYFGKFDAFTTTVLAMLVLVIIEFVFWKLIYSGTIWFFNYVDWIIPAFIIASVIYFVSSIKK